MAPAHTAEERLANLEGWIEIDVHDFVRLDRWIGRGGDPERLPDMDSFCYTVSARARGPALRADAWWA